MSRIYVSTRWGKIPASYTFIKQTTDSQKIAVIFPGRGYILDAPLMWYSASAAYDSGCDVLGVEYGYQANRADFKIEEQDYLVDEIVGALENIVTGQYSSIVFIAKSMGTIIQDEVLQRVSFSVRHHVFLTPLRKIIPAIRQSEHALVVVGDNDGLFVHSDITQVTNLSNVQLHVVPGADHGLETKDYRKSIDILKTTATLCGDFCKNLL